MGFEFSGVLNFLIFLGFYFYFNFFLFFFHLVKIYTKHQTQKSNPDFRNMGLNLIFWVLNLLGLCFVDLVRAGIRLIFHPFNTGILLFTVPSSHLC